MEAKKLIGKTIKDIRPCTDIEMKEEFWDGQDFMVIELDNGVTLYPSRDPEGNGPGTFFGKDCAGNSFMYAATPAKSNSGQAPY